MATLILDHTHTVWCICGTRPAVVLIESKGYCREHALKATYRPPLDRPKAKRIRGNSNFQREMGLGNSAVE